MTLEQTTLPPTAGNSDRRVAYRLGAAALLVYLAFIPANIFSSDANSMYAVAYSLVTGHGFSVLAPYGPLGTHGLHYSIFYPLLSIVSTPLVAIAYGLATPAHASPFYLGKIFALVTDAGVTAATIAIVFLLTTRMGGGRRLSIAAALSYGFSTMALVYARDFFAEPLLGLCTVGAVYLALGQRTVRQVVSCSALCAFAVLAKPTGLVVGIAITVYLFFTVRRSRCVRGAIRYSFGPALGTASGGVAYAAYDLLRFGSVTTTGPGRPGFGISEVWQSFPGLLVSPGRGLIWFSLPILVLIGFKWSRPHAQEIALLLSIPILYLCLYSLRPDDWFGIWSWGPRYLLPALPLLFALTPLVRLRVRRALVPLAIVGTFTLLPTLFSFWQLTTAQETAKGVSLTSQLWSPIESPLVQIWATAPREISAALSTNVRTITSPAASALTKPGSLVHARSFRVVNDWWWMTPVGGVPRLVGIVIAFLFLAAGIATIGSLLCAHPARLRQSIALE
jgi:hypothetical protein